jgi:hypothetical protein
MRRCILLATMGMFIFGLGLAWAQKPSVKPRQPTPVISLQKLGPQGAVLPLLVSNTSVSPGSVTFTSANPDGSVTGLTNPTTVQFRTSGSPATGAFRVWARSGNGNFTGCNAPPAGNVTVACQSATTGVTCDAAAALTTAGNGTLVAHGSGNHNPNRVTVQYTFQDGWNFQVGTACSLSVTYYYTAP